MTIQAIIWDLGGVLVRTEDWGAREALAEHFGLTRSELEKQMFDDERGRKGQLGEISGEAHWEALGEQLGMDAQELVDKFFSGDQLDDQLIDYLRKLKSDYKIGLLSNAFSTLRKHLEEDLKIEDIFDEIIISAEIGLAKPDKAIYQFALDRLEVAAEACVFVDDFEENVEAARKMGIKAVHFLSREQAIADVDAHLAAA